MATLQQIKLYVQGFLPQSSGETLNLKNAVERELRKISVAFDDTLVRIQTLRSNISGLLGDYLNKTDGSVQTVTNSVVFKNDLGVEADSVGVFPVLDLENSRNLFVPKLLPTVLNEDVNAATKGYVDVIINAAKNSTDYTAFKAAITAAFP